MLFRSLGALVESNNAAQLEMAMPPRDPVDDGDDGDTLNVSISMGEGLVDELDDEVEPAAADIMSDAPPPGSQLH